MPPASRVKPASGTARTGGPSPARVGKWWGERLASLAPPSLPPQRRRICPRAAARASRPPDCRCEGHHIAAAGICTQSESVSGALEPAGSGGARSARGGKIGGGGDERGPHSPRASPLVCSRRPHALLPDHVAWRPSGSLETLAHGKAGFVQPLPDRRHGQLQAQLACSVLRLHQCSIMVAAWASLKDDVNIVQNKERCGR